MIRLALLIPIRLFLIGWVWLTSYSMIMDWGLSDQGAITLSALAAVAVALSNRLKLFGRRRGMGWFKRKWRRMTR